jgi:hypothetical protein
LFYIYSSGSTVEHLWLCCFESDCKFQVERAFENSRDFG